MFEWYKKSKLTEQLKFFGAKKQGFVSVYASKPRIRVKVKVKVDDLYANQISNLANLRRQQDLNLANLAAQGQSNMQNLAAQGNINIQAVDGWRRGGSHGLLGGHGGVMSPYYPAWMDRHTIHSGSENIF